MLTFLFSLSLVATVSLTLIEEMNEEIPVAGDQIIAVGLELVQGCLGTLAQSAVMCVSGVQSVPGIQHGCLGADVCRAWFWWQTALHA